MHRMLFLTLLFLASTAAAQPVSEASCPNGICVEKDDMDVFLQLAKDFKCRSETPPKIKSDSVSIIVDRDGRVYGSGNDPKPFRLSIDWCNYKIDAASEIQLQVAQRVEPTWGFRFRIKATFGLLLADAFTEDTFQDALDGGILLEPFFIRWVSLNGYVGIRSFGAGLGFDATSNFGFYTGYALTWGSWRSNPFISAYFAF